MTPARLFRRRLAWLLLVVCLALLRSERGVAELQGRTGEPGRLFRLAYDPTIERWTVCVAGYERALPEAVRGLSGVAGRLHELAREAGQAMKDALP